MPYAAKFGQEHVPGTECPFCQYVVQGLLIAHDVTDESGRASPQASYYGAYCIVQCPRRECNKTFYLSVTGQFSEVTGQIFDSKWRATWPPAVKRLDNRIPEDVREDYNQAYKCWSMMMNRAACLTLRRCLENACITTGATAHTLEDMIDELKDQGKIFPLNTISAHKTRIIGNFTAHVIREISSDEIRTALRLSEKILDDLFVTPALQQEINTTRPPKKKP
jgi:hypothetical protein